MRRQVRHQVHVERQFVRFELLEQRQNVAAVRRGDEVIGVFDAGGNALEAREGADRIIPEPRRRILQA